MAPRKPVPTRSNGTSTAAWTLNVLVHVAGTCMFAYVWGWHHSAAAALLPGADGFGWFYKYLTFWGLTMQLVSFVVSTVQLLVPVKGLRRALAGPADHLACTAFTVATVVTVQFHVIDYVTGGMVLPSAARPWWLGPSVHVANSVFAWLDVLVAPRRSFGRAYAMLSNAFVVAYTAWIGLCRYQNGIFPYPFLDKLPFPAGPLAVITMTIVVFYLIGRCGALVSHMTGSLTHPSARLPPVVGNKVAPSGHKTE